MRCKFHLVKIERRGTSRAGGGAGGAGRPERGLIPARAQHEPRRRHVGRVCGTPEKKHRTRARAQISEHGDAAHGGRKQCPQAEENPAVSVHGRARRAPRGWAA